MRTPTGETPFKLAYGSEAVISTKVHMANHRVMKYQNENNEEQLHLNLDLIDEVRMDAEQRTASVRDLDEKRPSKKRFRYLLGHLSFWISDIESPLIFLYTKKEK